MDYNTITPGIDLQNFIRCYWTLEAPAEATPEKQRIVPDGCMEMIFHYGDLFRQYLVDNNWMLQPRSFVYGQITSALDIQPTGRTGIFAVRFHPQGFTPFSPIPPHQMENRAVPLEELFGTEGNELGRKVLSAISNTTRAQLVEDFLLKRLATPQSVDKLAKLAVETILQLNGQLSVDQLSGQLRISRRLLERRFSSVIGLSPKQLSKMIRLQMTLKLLANGRFTSLTSLAYEGAYYDQAHFIRDFKEFTGVSPKRFFSENLKMSSLFVNSE